MNNAIRNRHPWIAIIGLALMSYAAWLAYLPGLSGGFLFDDFVNMPVLGYYGRIDNWTAFWLYITSGSADPTGRPLAMLSFLIDANDWPADPYSFKRTSVLLHMLNGSLLTWLLLKLGRTSGRAETVAAGAAVLGAALWLLHPLLVSTTLYVVQRETILAATFVLLGLLGYARGRELAERGRILGIWLAALSIGTGTVLALLCKANGILLPLLALVTEIVLLAPTRPLDHPRTRRAFAIMCRGMLILPSLLLGAYLFWKAYSGFVNGMPALRSWTLGERLLTEARIVVKYFGLLWLPRAFSPGLFNDDIAVSIGLFSPPATVLCLLAIFVLATAVWRVRKAHPALALAIVFFLAGHLLESTVLPLELYFEHRNYLPAVFMFWPLALWICSPANANRATQQPHAAYARHALAILLPLGLGMLTHLAADLWGNERDQALVWAARNPHSPRAQVTAAQIERTRGENAAATARLERALRENPREIQLVLNLLGAKCEGGGLTETDIEHAADALRTTPNPGRVGGDWFIHSLDVAQNGNCPGLTLDVLDRLLAASAENPRTQKTPGRDQQDRLSLQGRIALLRGQDERALTLFNEALDADLRPDAALDQTAIMATAGKQRLAQRHLNYFVKRAPVPAGPGWTMPTLHAWLLHVTGYWDHEIDHMRKTLDQDIAEQNASRPSQ